MNNTKPNRLLLWVAIVLLSGNLVVLSFIWFKPPIKNELPVKSMYNNKSRNNFERQIANELQLNPHQIDRYHELKKIHMAQMWTLRDSIKQYKWLIHQELLKENPDIYYINQLSDSIGLINATFEKNNYNHFIELKKGLNEEQLERFEFLLESLPYGNRQFHGKGRHRRCR